jgi:hypothetical protein
MRQFSVILFMVIGLVMGVFGLFIGRPEMAGFGIICVLLGRMAQANAQHADMVRLLAQTADELRLRGGTSVEVPPSPTGEVEP